MTKDEAVMAIWVVEDTITKRRMIEAVLGIDGGWLQRQHDEMARLRDLVGGVDA